ncbi:MAG: tyrosine-type recombinase/integrase [Chitinophagales bacterium]
MKSERLYWNRFYKRYSAHLYSLGCFDNYVGLHFKIIKTFFNYLNTEKLIFTGNFQKNFYVRKESVPIIVISPEQLQFLIHDIEFETSLPVYLQYTKDTFVFGCTVGLRFSDLMSLTKTNVECTSLSYYLNVRSGKTSVDTRIKLPEYAVAILKKYRGRKQLLPQVSNNRLNENIKELCLKAGWCQEVGKKREKHGITKNLNKNGKAYRFCDLVSTHTMRRTAVTTLLSFGMPETMVRKISGHAANSPEFYRYVNYAQQFIDAELDRIYQEILPSKNSPKIAKTTLFS